MSMTDPVVEWNRLQYAQSHKRLVKIAALVKADVPRTEIAKLLGLSRNRLYQLIDKAKARGLL
jgi:DNA-binding transcriptional regulator LsrR (DeoR family)